MYRIKIEYTVDVWHDVAADTKEKAFDKLLEGTNFNPETVVSDAAIKVSTGMHMSHVYSNEKIRS